MLILLLREVLSGVGVLTVDGSCQVVAGIADRFHLRHDTEHPLYLRLRLDAETSVHHLIEVCGDFHLHVVGDGLILLNSGEQLFKFLLFLLVEQCAHESEHPLATLTEHHDFFLGVEDGEFRRLHQSGRDKAQPCVLILRLFFRFDYLAYDLLNLRHKPNHDKRVDQVEERMERREHE